MDSQSGVQKAMAKWESDERLGDMATVTAVLYTNMKHPDLVQKFPEWPVRYKEILKLWRKVSTDERKPYLTRAKENRAATKATKAQKLKEEKLEKASPSLGLPSASNERSGSISSYGHPAAYGGPLSRSFSTQESMESYYSSSQEDFGGGGGGGGGSGGGVVNQNPSTPMSQPSTPGSSASHVHHPQYHVGSPGPPFSPPLDRPRSVLSSAQHQITDQQARHGVQSPHSYQQVSPFYSQHGKLIL